MKKGSKHFLLFLNSLNFQHVSNIHQKQPYIQILPFIHISTNQHPQTIPVLPQKKSHPQTGTVFRFSHRMSLRCSSGWSACTRNSSLHQWLCCWRWRELYRRVALCPTNGRGGQRGHGNNVFFFRLDKRVGDDEKNYNRICTNDLANLNPSELIFSTLLVAVFLLIV